MDAIYMYDELMSSYAHDGVGPYHRFTLSKVTPCISNRHNSHIDIGKLFVLEKLLQKVMYFDYFDQMRFSLAHLLLCERSATLV